MDVAINATPSRAVLVSRILLGEDPHDKGSLAGPATRNHEPLTARADITAHAGPPRSPRGANHLVPPPGTAHEVSVSERVSFELSVTRLTVESGGVSVTAESVGLAQAGYDNDGDGRLTPADVAYPRLRLIDGSPTRDADGEPTLPGFA